MREKVYGDKAWYKKQWLCSNIIKIFKAYGYLFETGEIPYFKRVLMQMDISFLEQLCVSLFQFNDFEIVLKLVTKRK
jgi:hypothetical protein